MPAFIIFLDDLENINTTLNDLLDKTPKSAIEEVVVCNDSGTEWNHESFTVYTTDRIGRAKAWNQAVRKTNIRQLVFLLNETKFTQGWLEPISKHLEEDQDAIVAPIIRNLDVYNWSITNEISKNSGWRWNMRQYNRFSYDNKPACCHPSCFAITKQRFSHLEGFDEGMDEGDGEVLEFSIRNWLLGGSVHRADSIVGTPHKENYSLKNACRIVEAWFPTYANNFYDSVKSSPEEIHTGKLTNLTILKDKQNVAADDYLRQRQPELFNLFRLRGNAAEKNIAIVADGPSLDKINPALIYNNDVIISVGLVGLNFSSDFVFPTTAEDISILRSSYKDENLVMPVMLESKSMGNLVESNEIAPAASFFEWNTMNDPRIQIHPPFANFGHILHSAINFAMFLGSKTITIYGCDNKIINGKSHYSSIYYNDGNLWPDTKAVANIYSNFEYGLRMLSKLAEENGITILRVNHL
jgi:hypothetical protein